MKKSRLLTLIAIIACIIVIIFFQLNRLKNFDHNGKSLLAIPSNAAFILKSKNITFLQDRLNKEINFKAELLSSEIIKSIIEPLLTMDSISSFNSDIKEFLSLPLYSSFHPVGKDQVACIHLLELRNKKQENKAIAIIEGLSSHSFEISKRKYTSYTIFEIKKQEFPIPYYISIKNGQLLCSTNSLLLEMSIRQIQSGNNWTNTESFQRVKKTTSATSNINLFVNIENLPKVLRTHTDKSFQKTLQKIQTQSEWGELDMEIKSNGILLNGFFTNNNNGIYASLLKDSKGEKKRIIDVLPSSTKAYITLSLENGQELKTRISKYYQKSQEKNRIIAVEKKYGVNISDQIFSIASGSLAMAYDSKSTNGILVLEVESQSHAQTVLEQLLKNCQAPAKPAYTYQADKDLSFNIYKGLEDNIFESIFGHLFYQLPNDYFTLYKNHLIVADSRKQLEQFIYNNILNKTLKYHKNHQSFLENFSMKDNIFVFGETAHLPSITPNILKPLWEHISSEQKQTLANFYALGFQLSGTNDMIYATSFLKYLPNQSSEPETVWESLLDTVAISKPTLVKNHYSQEREVIVQDANNNLYLMNNNGRILWKKPLDGPILSEIIQVDYYKNKKLQYIFNTKNKIYLLDRNGNHVANYPIKLPSPATNGVAVIDYDKSRDYRFFIACQNKKVYLYNTKGNIVPGWKFTGSEDYVNQPIQHFRTSNKDYLVFSDQNRNYILDRRGNTRVSIQENFSRNKRSPFYIYKTNSTNAELITSSTNGDIKRIELETGKVNTIPVSHIEGSHKLNCYIQNGEIRYVISEPNKLRVFNKHFKEVFDYEFDNEINLNVDLYQFSANNIKFGVSELLGDNIYLLNNNGKLYKDFPLIGKSRFSIGFLKASANHFNLIVAGANNYLYNYRVE